MKKLIRVMPCLLIKNNYLVKGKNFTNHRYVGDIFNAVKIYSEKKVHEIQIIDISARDKNHCIDINLIKKIRSEISVPLAVGGGINSLMEVSALINEGVEKVILNSVNFQNKSLINEVAQKFGSQSIVVSVDVKKLQNKYEIYSNNGKKKEPENLSDFLKHIQDSGAGEIMLTSIEREGTKRGLDFDLYDNVKNLVHIPLIASGGTKNIENVKDFFDNFPFSAVSCGKIFIYFGNRDAVLINYPDKKTIENLMNNYE